MYLKIILITTKNKEIISKIQGKVNLEDIGMLFRFKARIFVHLIEIDF